MFAGVLALLLALVVAGFHGWCLFDGSVLDDHWHQRGLREHGWSAGELQRSVRIEPAQWMHLWWQDQPMYWEYARPLFIVVMKLVYHTLGGDDPFWLHLLSVVLHWACALLVARVAFRLTESRAAAVVGGLLYCVYPHSIITVAWPSSQNAVLFIFFALISMLAYWRASGLDVLVFAGSRRIGPPPPPRAASPSLSTNWFAVSVVAWLLALLTRENALALPVFFAACDFAFGGAATVRRRLGAYVGFAIACVAFLAWRTTQLGSGLPEVYYRAYAGEGIEYPLWLLAKLLHYFVTSIWIAPMTVGPTGRFNPWTEAPGDCALMLAILVGVGSLYTVAARGRRGWWLWPLWILLMLAPLLPVIATPHSGYLAAVGVAVGWAVAYARLDVNRYLDEAYFVVGESRVARFAGGVGAIGGIALFVGFCVLSRWQWTAVAAAERYFNESVRIAAPPAGATDVFVLNVPFVNVYAKPALDHLDPGRFRELRWHVLAFSPQPVVVEEPVFVEQLDEHRLALTSRGQPFFSRLLGRFLIDAFRSGGRFHAGDTISTPHFDVLIADADVGGVRRIEFSFPRPLSDPSYCFYVSTMDCGAARLRFDPQPDDLSRLPANNSLAEIQSRVWTDGDAGAIDALFAAEIRESDSNRAPRSGEANAADYLRATLGPVMRALASPLQDRVDRAASAEDWRVLRAWWQDNLSDDLLRELRVVHEDLAFLVKLREELPHARMWAARVIRSDLYLTGPPFPTNREELAKP